MAVCTRFQGSRSGGGGPVRGPGSSPTAAAATRPARAAGRMTSGRSQPSSVGTATSTETTASPPATRRIVAIARPGAAGLPRGPRGRRRGEAAASCHQPPKCQRAVSIAPIIQPPTTHGSAAAQVKRERAGETPVSAGRLSAADWSAVAVARGEAVGWDERSEGPPKLAGAPVVGLRSARPTLLLPASVALRAGDGVANQAVSGIAPAMAASANHPAR